MRPDYWTRSNISRTTRIGISSFGLSLALGYHERRARLAGAVVVVPVVIWDAAEIHPPAHDGLAQLRDVESGAQRTLWMRPRMREKWLESTEARRTELNQLFASRGMRPFYVAGHFDGEAMSQYFFEVAA